MYTNVRGNVLHGRDIGADFSVDGGVLQGCPASPRVFALFMDRLEKFLLEKCEAWPEWKRRKVRVAGVLCPLLLFADDIVLASADPKLT